MFIHYYKNGNYLQEYFAEFIWVVKNVQGGLPKLSRLIYCGPGVLILKVEQVEKMPYKTPYFGFCWKLKVLSIQCMAGFGNFRPEAN